MKQTILRSKLISVYTIFSLLKQKMREHELRNSAHAKTNTRKGRGNKYMYKQELMI